MGDELERLRRNYAPLLLKHVSAEDEAGLRSAYELGRDAMRHDLGLLDVVRVHNETCLDVMDSARDVDDTLEVARAASALLLELIAAFEMTQRGFMDVGLRRTDDAT
jgi:hypothetical protein